MKTLKAGLGHGPAIVVQLEPPAGSQTDELIQAALGLPDWITALLISDNPSASPRMSPLVAARILVEKGFETILTLTCRDRNRLALTADLLAADALQLKNMLCVTGDHPVLGPVPQTRPVYDLDSLLLLELIRDLNRGLGLNGTTLNSQTRLLAGAVVNPEATPLEPQLAKFRLKAAAGAEFFLSQAVFRPERFLALAEEARKLEVKVLAGLRLFGPDEVEQILARRRPGLYLPSDLRLKLESSPDEALDRSLELAQRVVQALKGQVDGFVVMAPGLALKLPELLSQLGLV